MYMYKGWRCGLLKFHWAQFWVCSVTISLSKHAEKISLHKHMGTWCLMRPQIQTHANVVNSLKHTVRVCVCVRVSLSSLNPSPQRVSATAESCACLLVSGLQQLEQKKKARAVPVCPALTQTRSAVVLECQAASSNLTSWRVSALTTQYLRTYTLEFHPVFLNRWIAPFLLSPVIHIAFSHLPLQPARPPQQAHRCGDSGQSRRG